jgi:thiamine pyrophosphate-dependent acetolactate synthase large subunit-like protein
MGVGLPYAIAARLSCPERPVVALTGDMGLWMCLGELGIVQERQLDLVVVYFSDATLSLIELKQEREGLVNSGVRFCNPDVVSLAKAFGGVGITVQGAENISAAINDALKSGGLWLVEVMITPQPYRKQM